MQEISEYKTFIKQFMDILDRVSEIDGLELKVSADSTNDKIKLIDIKVGHVKFKQEDTMLSHQITPINPILPKDYETPKPINPIYRGIGDLGEWWKKGPTCESNTETNPESLSTVLTDLETGTILDITIPEEYLSTTNSIVSGTSDKRQEYTISNIDHAAETTCTSSGQPSNGVTRSFINGSNQTSTSTAAIHIYGKTAESRII